VTTFERGNLEQLDNADIRVVLDRVVASPGLSKSPQLVSFLRFVVETVLTGKGRQIKAYTIATDALGRDARFDPQTDPIVRVEAGRLRRALRNYYANGGGNDAVLIELPRGSYVPLFRANTAPRGSRTRMQGLRHNIVETVHDNYRMAIMIIIVAATVSLSFDMMWMLLGKKNWPAGEMAQQIAPPGISRAVFTDD